MALHASPKFKRFVVGALSPWLHQRAPRLSCLGMVVCVICLSGRLCMGCFSFPHARAWSKVMASIKSHMRSVRTQFFHDLPGG